MAIVQSTEEANKTEGIEDINDKVEVGCEPEASEQSDSHREKEPQQDERSH